jgi:hypothetical protein
MEILAAVAAYAVLLALALVARRHVRNRYAAGFLDLVVGPVDPYAEPEPKPADDELG